MIYLIRHGQSESNLAGLLVGRSNPPLTDLGRTQAAALRPLLTGVVEVWTSPLQRARETAAVALPDVPATVHAAFIEVDYGSLDGTPLAALTKDQWEEMEGDHERPFGGGESLAEVDRRVHPVLESLRTDATSLLHDPDRHLAIVSHVSPVKSALVWAMGVHGSAAWRMRIENASLSVIAGRRDHAAVVRVNTLPLSP